jgi:Phytanoyl-CoA dioxygenase (PhyH)
MTELRKVLESQGWVVARDSVPSELCERLLSVLETEMHVPIHDPSRWHEYANFDLVPIWGHQAQWDIRQLPQVHALWAELWGRSDLWVSLDMCRFTPPWRSGDKGPLPIHWDHNPHDLSTRMIQGVVALTETPRGQGGFRCVPSLFNDPGAWATEPIRHSWGEEWQPDVTDSEVVEIPVAQGDLILWDSRLPHANSRNDATQPRIAFYLQMFPSQGEEERRVRLECYREGKCLPFWRARPGADRAEPWPPAELTLLGRRLLGKEAW